MATITNPNNRPIVTAETTTNVGVSVGIDYTAYYDRIATALETIATNSTAIKNSLAAIESDIDTMATQTTTIATQQTTLATKVTDMRDMAFNDGIHIKSPWEYLGMYSLINLFNEKGWNKAEAKSTVESTSRHRG